MMVPLRRNDLSPITLLTMHGGNILVNSEIGKGTTFEVHFKPGTAHFDKNVTIIYEDKPSIPIVVAVSTRSLNDQIDTNPEESNTGNQPLMLVVEDNAELCRFLTSVLSEKYRVAEASDGHVAWNMMGNLMPDFVITDLMMPVMDGLELTRHIKEDDRTCHIPVIMLTAKSDMITQMECIQAGVTDFIAKPFSAVYLAAGYGFSVMER